MPQKFVIFVRTLPVLRLRYQIAATLVFHRKVEHSKPERKKVGKIPGRRTMVGEYLHTSAGCRDEGHREVLPVPAYYRSVAQLLKP